MHFSYGERGAKTVGGLGPSLYTLTEFFIIFYGEYFGEFYSVEFYEFYEFYEFMGVGRLRVPVVLVPFGGY